MNAFLGKPENHPVLCNSCHLSIQWKWSQDQFRPLEVHIRNKKDPVFVFREVFLTLIVLFAQDQSSFFFHFYWICSKILSYLSLWPQVIGDALGWGFVVRGMAPCYVQAVDPGSPAAAAGVKVSNYITHFALKEQIMLISKGLKACKEHIIVFHSGTIIFRFGSLCARWMDSVFSTWTIERSQGWWWQDLSLLLWKLWNRWNDSNRIQCLTP